MNPLRLRMVLSLALLLAAVPAAVLPTAQADSSDTYYAAIAFSESTGRYGYSHGWLNSDNARRIARSHCRADDARVVICVGNGWCALARGDSMSAYGFGYARTAAEARSIALREARKRTTNCYIAVCVYSG